MTSHSYHRIPWGSLESEICLTSEISVGVDSRPHMLVEVTLDFFVKFALLSMVERGFYDFGSYVTPTTYYSLAFDNPSLDAQMPPGRKSIAAHWSLRCMVKFLQAWDQKYHA